MWKISESYDWNHLHEQFAWVRDMTNVPQDPIHHAEGNVAIHTERVMNALQELPAFQRLQEQEQHVLLAGALLHDVEKRSTTEILANGRVASPGHAKNGEPSSRAILYRDLAAPFHLREQVAKIVRYHGLPLWVFAKPNPAKAIIAASMQINTEYLAMIAKADVLGRECEDADELLYRIELFREYCAEYNCLGQPRPFEAPHARFEYFQKAGSLPEYVPFEEPAFEEPAFEVVLMSAIPGSGKDTFINKHLGDSPVVSLDAIRTELGVRPTDRKGNGRVVQEAKQRARQYLRAQQSFVWNATNTSQMMREQLIDLFTTYKAAVRVIYLEVPYRTLLMQNANRTAQVPRTVIDRITQRWDVPSLVEAHNVEWHVRHE